MFYLFILFHLFFGRSVYLSLILSFCEQDNSQTRKQTSTKHGTVGMGKG